MGSHSLHWRYSWLRDWTWVSHIAGRSFTVWVTGEAQQCSIIALNTLYWIPDLSLPFAHIFFRVIYLSPLFSTEVSTWKLPSKCSLINDLMSVQFSCSNSLWPHGLQHTRLPCPSPTPGACSNSCPSGRWCHPTISSSVTPFSCLSSFPASGFFPMSQFFTSGGQSIGVLALASVLPMNI